MSACQLCCVAGVMFKGCALISQPAKRRSLRQFHIFIFRFSVMPEASRRSSDVLRLGECHYRSTMRIHLHTHRNTYGHTRVHSCIHTRYMLPSTDVHICIAVHCHLQEPAHTDAETIHTRGSTHTWICPGSKGSKVTVNKSKYINWYLCVRIYTCLGCMSG